MSVTTIEGPIHGGDRGWPFGAAAFDLGNHGYIEEEYFLSGTAARYDHEPGTGRSFDGKWSVRPTATAPYRVRMLVRRPADAARFNGTVVLMWNNVSIGYEIFTGESDALYRIGCAFVGVGVQRIGIDGYPEGDNRGLRAWDPRRYSELGVADDAYSYDIFTAAAQVVGAALSSSPDPLGGLRVARVLGLGVSQSATYLATYLNAIQPLSRALDGVLLDVYFGNGALLDPAQRPRTVTRPDQIAGHVVAMPPGTHLLRDDLDIPVFVVNSETEASSYYPVRQPDSDRFRFWEVAGVAHGSDRISDIIPSTWPRDFGFSGHPLAPAGPNNALTLDGVRAAALVRMHEWMAHRTPPPVMPRIEFTGDPPVIARDEHGIAKGGIRLPDVAAPRACHKGVAVDGSLALFGSTVPFSDATLRELYPDEDTYRARYAEAQRACLDAGVLLA